MILGANDAVIPDNDNITIIGDYAFFGQEKRTQIVIPEGVQSIRNQAFMGCSSLTDVYIPISVTTIDCIFEGCPYEVTIHYSGTIQQWKSISVASYLGDMLHNVKVICTDGELITK